MRLLLDTHFVIWLTGKPDLISPDERAIIFADDAEVVVSAASIWEIRLKWQSLHKSGVRKGDVHPEAALRLVETLNFAVLPVTAALAAAALRDPVPHKDPFDELLLVQAQEEGLQLLTRDRLLAGHPLVAA